MKTLINTVQLVGHVGQDPEIRILEDGKKLAKFSLATNEQYTNALGEQVEKTYWHHVIFWNRAAEIVEKYVKKGNKVAIEGKLAPHSWIDSDGGKHYFNEIVGRELMLL